MARTVFSDVAIEAFVPLHLSPARGERAVDIEDAIARIGPSEIVVSLNRTNDDDVGRLAEGIGASETAGLFPNFTISVSFDHQMHCADLAFEIPRRFNDTLHIEAFSGPPALGAEGARRGRQFARLLPPGMKTLIVHADTSREKEWATARLQRTLDAFLSAHSDFLSLVLGSRDIGIQPGATNRIFSAVGLPLEVSLALVGRGTAFLGVDSSLLHAADLFRLPCAALFGPGDSRQFGCRFCRHEYITAPSMAQITEELVLQALERVVARAWTAA